MHLFATNHTLGNAEIIKKGLKKEQIRTRCEFASQYNANVTLNIQTHNIKFLRIPTRKTKAFSFSR